MGQIKHQASAEEKLRIIKAYLESGETKAVFIEKHGLSTNTLTRWIEKFNEEGEAALRTHADRTFDNIAPNLKTEAALREEILKLRIENERLKKNYIARKTEDGKTEYIRLRAKNSE
ncbi:MAG: Transposase [Clostridiales bacterium]|jgi:transposase-like protein|nr:Transposase [Clostridiales bacterium]